MPKWIESRRRASMRQDLAPGFGIGHNDTNKAMTAFFIPQHWPESEVEEAKLDARVEADFPFDEKQVVTFVGQSAPPAPNIRIRIFRELASWMVFEQLVTALLAGAVLLLAWSFIAQLNFKMIYLLIIAFLAMQLIYGVGSHSTRTSARNLANLLQAAHEYGKPTWTMLMCSLERIVTTLYRVRARGTLAAILSIVASIILFKQHSLMFATSSLVVIALTAYLNARTTARYVRSALVAVKYETSGRTAEELGAAIEIALHALGANLENWYSRKSRRPGSGARLRLPKRHLMWLSAFDVELSVLAVVPAGYLVYRYRDFSFLDYRPLADGLPTTPLLAVSALLALMILAILRLSGYARWTNFHTLILRRFSLDSDLLTRRVTGPILAACGPATVVVPQALALEDQGSGGAIIGKGLRRSWLERLIDVLIVSERNRPSALRIGVPLIVRGALARAETVTFADAEWEQRVTELLKAADFAVIDVSDLSTSVRFEMSTARAMLPGDRIVYLCAKDRLPDFADSTRHKDEAISDMPRIVAYTSSYFGRISLRWKLCRLLMEME